MIAPLVVMPAGVTFMNFSPWSGWIVFDEFDILILGTLAAGYLQLADIPHRAEGVVLSRRLQAVLLALGCMALYSLSRAFSDAGGIGFDWFAGYTCEERTLMESVELL